MMPGLDPARLVFLDETRASTRTARTLGRAPRGERLIATVPHGRWHITTFVGALRRGGFTAPPVVEGAMNGPTFLAYVRQFLAPALAPGGVVVMDNLSAHKVPGVREAIEAGGAALLYLPPYSPDLNPIELAFGKLEGLLRSAAERTTEALWRAIGALLSRFSSEECAAYFLPPLRPSATAAMHSPTEMSLARSPAASACGARGRASGAAGASPAATPTRSS
jgi:transposase